MKFTKQTPYIDALEYLERAGRLNETRMENMK